MDRNEVKKNLYEAGSAKEVQEILNGLGFESNEEEATKLFKEIQLFHSASIEELSEDELAAISGGRDYAKDGCAATVEPGSDCWGEDGGCIAIHFSYSHPPIKYQCKKCGTYLYRFKQDPGSIFKYGLKCRNCGATYIEIEFAP